MQKEQFKLLELLPIGVTISTPEGKILDVNSTGYKMSGFETKEAFIESSEIVHWLDSAKRKEFLELVQKKGLARNFEVQVKREDNSVAWVSISAKLQKTKTGEARIISTFSNITKRKKTEEKIGELNRKTEKELATIIPILQKIAMGDLSKNFEIPEKESKFTELLVALNLMIDDLRASSAENKQKTEDLKKTKAELEKKVQERTKDLQEKIDEAERMNRLMTGRELKMIELKKEIEKLKESK